MPSELIILFTAMLPIAELRLAIPLAVSVYKMSIYSAFFWSVLGNLIPVIFILWFLKSVSDFLRIRSHYFNSFFNKLFKRTKEKHFRQIERWKDFSLVLLVAIPLPFTGAWTGALVAFVFGIPVKKAFPLIAVGVLIAGLIVSLATMGVINFPLLR